MTEVTARLKNYRQSPRKVRLVAELIKGKSVKDALSQLTFLNKDAALPMKKLILSAVANAKSGPKVAEADLVVKNVTVNQGMVMKRFMPRAFGRAYQVRKKMSHVDLTLEAK
jgi:large subunit ribosomal protein L22